LLIATGRETGAATARGLTCVALFATLLWADSTWLNAGFAAADAALGVAIACT
jgi:hypothetical protein